MSDSGSREAISHCNITSPNVWKMIASFNMQNKCSKIESKGKHQVKDKEIKNTEIITKAIKL